MKKYLLLSLNFVLLFSACGKIELPEENTDSPLPDDTTVFSDTISVADFITGAETGTVYWVKGYIVGFIDGTSKSHAVFDLPYEKANTNMLLADNLDEYDVGRCIPVKLEANTVYRRDLNLYDHPELYLQPIVLMGLCKEYFKMSGITTLYDYRWSIPERDTPYLDNEWQYVEEGRVQKKNAENSYR